MSSVSSSFQSSTVGLDSKKASVDLVAEREALAIERLAELLGTAVPRSRLQQRLDEGAYASELGRSAPKHPVYARVKSYKAHHKLETASMSYLVHGSGDKYPHFDDPATRQAKVMRRARKLFAIKQVNESKWIGLAEAARMTAIGERTLQRAAAKGNLPAHRDFTPTPKNGVGRTGRYLVRVKDVRRILELKLSGGAIAAA